MQTMHVATTGPTSAVQRDSDESNCHELAHTYTRANVKFLYACVCIIHVNVFMYVCMCVRAWIIATKATAVATEFAAANAQRFCSARC